jgi:ADP-heptose:LPS heptosyltransferase
VSAIVAIRLRAMGDVVLTTPAFASLAAGHPDDELHVVTESRFAPLLSGLPFIHKVWGIERSTLSTVQTGLALRRLAPKLAVDFFGNSRSALIAKLAGANRVFGYALRGRQHAYDVTVPRELRGPHDSREHASAVHLRLARAAGGAEVSLTPRVALDPVAVTQAQALLASAGVRDTTRAVGIVAAGSWPTKMWPVSHSAVLARELLAAGHEVLVIAGPGEDALTRRLVSHAPGVRVLPPCGVAALAAVIARLRAVVGTDSGPRHLAAAFGVPSFAWFGPTHPATWNPPGAMHGFWRTSLPCRGCDLTRCAHWNCLPGLDPAQGAALVLAHLEAHQALHATAGDRA